MKDTVQYIIISLTKPEPFSNNHSEILFSQGVQEAHRGFESENKRKGKSGLLSTAAEIDSDKGVSFCLLAQCCSDLICCCWGEGDPRDNR